MIYSDIQLTEDEIAWALADAREKKYFRIVELQNQARAAELRRFLTQPWTFEMTRKWVVEHRIEKLFPGENIQFEDVKSKDGDLICNAGTVFTLLCLYFSNDPEFFNVATHLGVPRPDLRKGLLLIGGVGRGKTSLMQLFQRNRRQVFMIKNAGDVAYKWRAAAEKAGEYLTDLAAPYRLPVNDSQNFFHEFAGLCIDDAGTEDVQNSFGNKASVIGDLLELRYNLGMTGSMLHMTTNLSTKGLKEYYGDRVSSRLRETMNIIEYKGEDRRK